MELRWHTGCFRRDGDVDRSERPPLLPDYGLAIDHYQSNEVCPIQNRGVLMDE